jgi:proteasome accessory factor C
MAERETADERLGRILAILPRAVRAGGVSLAELAGELGLSETQVVQDLQEVYTREYYHPAGSGQDVQVLIEPDEVHVFTTREFRRPSRLSPREMLALGLGLRVLAAESAAGARPAMLGLAERLESGVIGAMPRTLLEGIGINPGAESAEGIRSVLVAAAGERRRCSIAYLRPGATEPEPRAVDPYVLLSAGGNWYLIAWCHRSGDTRVFRADRVVAVELLEERFTLPEGFDPAAYVREGRVYRAGEDVEEVEVEVRYSPRISRWIEERGPVEAQADGSVVVRYRVADPAWLVRHVLEHGPDAEVLRPAEMREAVAAAAVKVRRSHPS